MLLKIQECLRQYVGARMAYLIVFTCYFIITSTILLSMGYVFNIVPFVVVSTIVVNSIRKYSFGYHESDNVKCMIMTIFLITIIGMVSNEVGLVVSLIVGVLSIRYIIEKSPLKITQKGKSEKYHRDRIKRLVALYLTLSLVFLYFEQYLLVNNIMWSFFLVALTLFENIDRNKK